MTLPRVLVVDDNEDLLEIIKIFCELEGYPVRVATDGAAGLAMIDAFLPEVLLLDLMMPGIDGFGVLESLQAERKDRRPARVIAISALTDYETVARLKSFSVDGFLPKPFSLDELQALLVEPVIVGD